jgi:hypothetical protein
MARRDCTGSLGAEVVSLGPNSHHQALARRWTALLVNAAMDAVISVNWRCDRGGRISTLKTEFGWSTQAKFRAMLRPST